MKVCSFCQKTEAQVKHIITSKNGDICSGCVALCVEILFGKFEETSKKELPFENPPVKPDACRDTQNIDFGTVIACLRMGYGATRIALGDNTSLKLQIPDINSKMSEIYIYLETNCSGKIKRAPWVPTYEDILATDWRIV